MAHPMPVFLQAWRHAQGHTKRGKQFFLPWCLWLPVCLQSCSQLIMSFSLSVLQSFNWCWQELVCDLSLMEHVITLTQSTTVILLEDHTNDVCTCVLKQLTDRPNVSNTTIVSGLETLIEGKGLKDLFSDPTRRAGACGKVIGRMKTILAMFHRNRPLILRGAMNPRDREAKRHDLCLENCRSIAAWMAQTLCGGPTVPKASDETKEFLKTLELCFHGIA